MILGSDIGLSIDINTRQASEGQSVSGFHGRRALMYVPTCVLASAEGICEPLSL